MKKYPGGKKAKTSSDAFEMQEKYEDRPHGRLQWKGTDVCMDAICKCGAVWHIDGYFMDHWKCRDCGTVYACNQHIEMIEIEEEPEDVFVPDLDQHWEI